MNEGGRIEAKYGKRRYKRKFVAVLAAIAITFWDGSALAELAVVAADGKQVRVGDNPAGVQADTVSILDLNSDTPSILATIQAPTSMIGPPTSIAVAGDSSYALVTAAQKIDPAHPGILAPNDTGVVIDLRDPHRPAIVQTFKAGPGAGGISINRAGTMALVASTEDSAIRAYTISRERLTLVGKVVLENGHPTDVVFTPDGREALAVERGSNGLEVLNVARGTITDTGIKIVTGNGPYGAVVTKDGRFVINTNHFGLAPDGTPLSEGAITVVDLASLKVVDSMVVGTGPEHVTISPSGNYLEVTLGNKAAVSPNDPRFSTTHGLIRIFQFDNGRLLPITTMETGHWCQGSTWNRTGTRILLECAAERDIEVYRFDGINLARETSDTLTFNARPGAIATAYSRP